MDLSFEDALKQLETIVEAMEDEKTTLEASIALYKEGLTLSEHCGKILERLESDIIILQKENHDTGD